MAAGEASPQSDDPLLLEGSRCMSSQNPIPSLPKSNLNLGQPSNLGHSPILARCGDGASQPLFSEIVKGLSGPRQRIATTSHEPRHGQIECQPHPFVDTDHIVFKPITSFQGQPDVTFPISAKKTLIDNVKHVLVGKFSHGRPRLAAIHEFFVSLKLNGTPNVSIYDNKHVFIECYNKFDFVKIWLKLVWNVKGFTMRVFKWGPDFTPDKESSIVPVWVRFEGLPLYMFDEMSLLDIGNSLGKPIKVDPMNVNRSILNSARVCIEFDLAKPLLHSIWISFVDEVSKEVLDRFSTSVCYDVVPSYCSSCFHIGHGHQGCKRKHSSRAVVAVQSMQSAMPVKVDGATANLEAPQATSSTGLVKKQITEGVSVSNAAIHTSDNLQLREGMTSKIWQPITRQRQASSTQSSDPQTVAVVSVKNSFNSLDLHKAEQVGLDDVILHPVAAQIGKADRGASGVTSQRNPGNVLIFHKAEHGRLEFGQISTGTTATGGSDTQKKEMVAAPVPGDSFLVDKQNMNDSKQLDTVAGRSLHKHCSPASAAASEIVQPENDAAAFPGVHAELLSVQSQGSKDQYLELQGHSYSCRQDATDGVTARHDTDGVTTGAQKGIIAAKLPAFKQGDQFFSNELQGQQVTIGTVDSDSTALQNGESSNSGIWIAGTELLPPKRAEVFFEDLRHLQQRIDTAGSAVIAEIEASPSSADFVNNIVSANKFIRQVGRVSPLAMADLLDFDDRQEVKGLNCDHLNSGNLVEGSTSVGADSIAPEMSNSWASKPQQLHGGVRKSWADLVEENDVSGMESKGEPTSVFKGVNKGHVKVAILPKLCFDQVSKRQSGAHKAWNSTIQVAHLGEGPGIVKTALLQLNNNRRTTRIRGQDVPYDDNG